MASAPSRSIRSQFVLMTIGLLITMGTITYVLANNYGKQAAGSSFDRLLTGAALQISENITINNGQIVIDLPWSAFETLSLAHNDKVFYQIIDVHGEYLTGYGDLPAPIEDENITATANIVKNTEPLFYDAQYKNDAVRFLRYRKLLTETDYQGVITILIGHTKVAREAFADDITLRAIQLVFPFIFAGFLLVLFGIWQTLKPINKLNASIAKRTISDLNPINHRVPAEIEPLVDTINSFMGRLENNLERLKNFTSEAAHQLRTPLAGLRSQAENALTETDEDVRKMQIQRVIESCDMLSNTVDKLLSQATISHRFQLQQLERVNLTKTTQQVCRDVTLSALQQGIEITFEGARNIGVLGDEFALQQMIRNLLENAIKYSPKDSTVDVSLHYNSSIDAIELVIRDSGIGIPDKEKPRVFERFYRSAANPRAGSGLGLSIAKEVADHHLASLVLEDNLPHGLVVKVIFNVIKEQ